ncbi:hypothetical protein SDC9_143829 [bioreactor metagenome]|uniref:Uncharacterized protein n=1 Tax=bioreactor metagenome TaxID=1076179 RepID=A0A645E4F7_9ZZZZ
MYKVTPAVTVRACASLNLVLRVIIRYSVIMSPTANAMTAPKAIGLKNIEPTIIARKIIPLMLLKSVAFILAPISILFSTPCLLQVIGLQMKVRHLFLKEVDYRLFYQK